MNLILWYSEALLPEEAAYQDILNVTLSFESSYLQNLDFATLAPSAVSINDDTGHYKQPCTMQKTVQTFLSLFSWIWRFIHHPETGYFILKYKIQLLSCFMSFHVITPMYYITLHALHLGTSLFDDPVLRVQSNTKQNKAACVVAGTVVKNLWQWCYLTLNVLS